MNLNPDFIDTYWQIVGATLFAVCLLIAAIHANWKRVRDQQDLTTLLATTVGVMMVWSINTGLATSLQMHFLGTTLLTLMFGWSYAVFCITLIISIISIYHGQSISLIPWHTILLGVIPVTFTWLFYHLVDSKLPNHFFIYIFLCAFLGAGISMALVMAATTMVQYLSGAYSMEFLEYNYYRYSILLVFPEAFMTGMLLTVFVVYKPEWVSTFDDRRYLFKK